ncbi:MAG: D-sedoheptulose 7-phosphate isomerase [Phascolarctobacterium sp.]|nr:D-sedoheptulose 7-phosphate isomerase [Phascolarctobacterium sp.]MBR2219673.1 D-sedoheptulose 7-phosphate isomerase [Phascolarctobacterium sp.]MBR6636755.1 D-sedoheptulose 7-phosphate isomerase [Phascolarctobacterium sp.]MBR6679552.1 D-sedoheptulose 7-phosphate isomerase [Phascolarctobacterium sp.]
MQKIIQERFEEHLAVANAVMQSDILEQVERVATAIKAALANGKKVLFCGNGGSAADSQHLAAEFVGRFQKERQGLPAIALTVDTSILTAVGNDYGFDKVFVRQVEALGNEGDVLIGISTSGTSRNVVAAVELAKAKGMYCVGMTSANGAKLAELCDECIAIPAKVTARAQEMHILIGHILCELVDGE